MKYLEAFLEGFESVALSDKKVAKKETLINNARLSISHLDMQVLVQATNGPRISSRSTSTINNRARKPEEDAWLIGIYPFCMPGLVCHEEAVRKAPMRIFRYEQTYQSAS
jgi:hypothetical protein